MTSDRVAVVVTCFNLGRTLHEAVSSVLSQTLPASELVIVDDGSDDPYTLQELARLERGGHRVIRTANRGVSAARNTGARSTSAPLLVLLDADDVLDGRYLDKMVARLDQNPALDFVSCAMQAFGGASYVWCPPDPRLPDSAIRGVVHISSLLRRVVWETVGGYDEGLPAHEDLEFWTTALEHGFRGEVIAEPLLRYRVRDQSNYHRAIASRVHSELMRAFYRKHWHTVMQHAEQFVVGKAAYLLEQHEHHAHVLNEIERRRLELARLRSEVARVGSELEALGRPALEMGEFRRTSPLSPQWGFGRGKPVDRYYIEAFLALHRQDVRGTVLEVKDPGYTRMFGDQRVIRSDVLDISVTNERATIHADLTDANSIADDTYDAFILTQTLGFIYDVRAALRHVFRVLKPGGVLLCTVPAAGRLSHEDRGLDGDYWRFTEASLRRLFAEVLPIDAFEVTGFGNVLACAAFLYGLADHELNLEELQASDPYLPLVYGIRAVKPVDTPEATGTGGDNDNPMQGTRGVPSDGAHPAQRHSRHASGIGKGVVLLYHRVLADPSEMRPHSVTLETFRGHMAVVRERYRVTSLGDLAREAQTRTLSGPAIAVTFDDGYAETLRLAGACLAELGIPATLFVTGEGLDAPCEFWWDQLERVFAGETALPVELAIRPAGTWLRAPTRSPEERVAAQRKMRELLYGATPDTRAVILESLAEWAGIDRSPRQPCRPVDRHELMHLAQIPGITIGAHTLHHACLPLLDEDGRRSEVVGNKKQLEGLIGRAVTAFAYPYGERDPATLRAVREAGFEIAVTVDERPVRNGTPRLLLPRCEAAESSQSEFAHWLEKRFGQD